MEQGVVIAISVSPSEAPTMASYGANRAVSDQAAIEGNPVALSILSLMDWRNHWSGTATELRQTLRERFPALTEDSHSLHTLRRGLKRREHIYSLLSACFDSASTGVVRTRASTLRWVASVCYVCFNFGCGSRI
ncbi:MAG: hypothetical protein JXQ88_21130, partial [Shimia sp.]